MRRAGAIPPFVYLQWDRDEMEVLFTLLAERYERRSVNLNDGETSLSLREKSG